MEKGLHDRNTLEKDFMKGIHWKIFYHRNALEKVKSNIQKYF